MIWDTIILDLYSVNANNDDILSFSQSLDTSVKYIKDEDRLNALMAVATLYGHLPKFAESSNKDNTQKNIIRTKMYILNAYSLVEQEKWDEIKIEIDKAEEAFKPVMTDVKFMETNTSRVNKVYIIINELRNSVSSNIKEIFYIKYKNLLMELNQII